ncbi:hypothetical protein [Amycolatopsis alkalitolerans]|uniref:hypothetical protein n=1 Tax=Amycolatopsis alkalitolerans TaxID=2547244 RepID=UPI00190F3BF8|nr:hypothetical protein [Amycolatopsis alkalitolerans]
MIAADLGLAKPPFLIQGVFGVLGRIGADHANLTHMVAIADNGAGRHQMILADLGKQLTKPADVRRMPALKGAEHVTL